MLWAKQASIFELARLARLGRHATHHVQLTTFSVWTLSSNVSVHGSQICPPGVPVQWAGSCTSQPPATTVACYPAPPQPASLAAIGLRSLSAAAIYPQLGAHRGFQHVNCSWRSDLPWLGTQGLRGFATRPMGNRRRTISDEPQASGPLVTTDAPWPWVDTTRPYDLPVWVGTDKPGPVSLQEAITKVKANVASAMQGLLSSHLSGRPRLPINDRESVELNIVFLTDPRKSDQIVRGVVVLPHGTGKRVRIAVFARGKEAETAKALGVDVLGDEELIQKIITSDGEAIDFDQLIATPEFAKPLARAGRMLGPKGLMPNPKMGTLTEDIATAVQAMRAGRLEFRVGKDKMLQVVVGKVNFTSQALEENVAALVACLLEQRPAALPGSGVSGYLSRMYLKSSRTAVVPVNPLSCEQLIKKYRPTPSPAPTPSPPTPASASTDSLQDKPDPGKSQTSSATGTTAEDIPRKDPRSIAAQQPDTSA